MLLCFLVLFLFFPSCHRAAASEAGELSEVLLRVQNALGGKELFITADSDFVETNLGNPDYLEDAVVCLGENGEAREFGVFHLRDRRKASELKETLRGYLKSEAEMLSSLASLYPAEELETRLALYNNATVGGEGMLVWYFVLNDSDTEKALGALTKR